MTIFNNTTAGFDKKKTETVLSIKNLRDAADSYNSKYRSEIDVGSEKKKILIENGLRSGKSINDIDMGAVYIPAKDTPILNYLYFSMRDDPQTTKTLLDVLREDKDIGKDVDKLREQLNKESGHLYEDDAKTAQPGMGTFLYGDVTLEMFDKIKKLKALSKSPNDQEAFLAYRKCIGLCTKYKLEFDKIPCDV